MGQFYYTVASLPMLKYDEPVDLKHSDYLEDCHKWLKPSEWDILKSSLINPETDMEFPGIAEEYRKWEISLRNELVALRSSALGLEADEYTRKGDRFADTASLAAAAFKEESPLIAENTLNKGRWEYIESLKVGHFFDLEFLVLYSLQLQIIERKRCFDEETGFAKYQGIYKNILSGIDDVAVGEQE
ncbi:DUF2764 family protein [Oceanispirochaeta crateris]|uniref:DUF2764 family protein n=1 Tax=Oceanispirochaeta crateris TaxID=2518645 RepID=A0A5C1QHU1_9SPIO|nr:DUF2764 family protein [Oceanispirochaeta crateris]QEN07715.1 DUF2764 family protein [Oceanispirochaeta crateris]